MILKELSPKKALNKAWLKVRPNRTEIERFKVNLISLLEKISIAENRPEDESEEHLKNDIRDFLRDTYYRETNAINTKDRKDLVIHLGKDTDSNVGVIIEAKRPSNKAEMITARKLNAKAFQELVLYYMRERIAHNNLEIKHLVATNINEWFIFDAVLFDRLFAQNKKFVNQFNDFEDRRWADTKTDSFYRQIAAPFIDSITAEIEFTYFNLRDYQEPLCNADNADDSSLIALFKLLSPEHLLKLPFANDSNSLDRRFYTELLHIIGLTESKEGGKKLIGRNRQGERHTGTIIEDAMIQLDSLNKLGRLENPAQFGTNAQEQLFAIALELSITWINRVLFLKLLEAQLITWHKGDKSYLFINIEKIRNYDDLNSLFFQVLARRHEERNEDVKKAFEKIPYLNSSLFEPTDLEQTMLFVSNLKSSKTIPVFSQTVLKDRQGRKRAGSLSTLEYLFAFLDAYDFSSEGSEKIQEESKTLINASVLGLIFEKINGYKDGSFFTPGFITMYMCRETIRRAVVQKFNETKKWNCTGIEELYDKIENRKEANDIVNSIRICDPAVGSGHFLVSALNEMIAVKNDLKILQDCNGRRLKEYQVEVENDELTVIDENEELFEYSPKNRESQRIQETLFHEKQTLIENCLFGVDINSNSVKICRLRLWIELLKNAYYKNAEELETLPNIDINIRCGNSLVSRFPIDADLKQALKKSKWTVDAYRIAVQTYRESRSSEEKRGLEKLIADIKKDFRAELGANNPKVKTLNKLKGDLLNMLTRRYLTEETAKDKKAHEQKQKKLEKEIARLSDEIDGIKSSRIYENAFEWRFEFPEVLNDDGDFEGFDAVIGNPPYIQLQSVKEVSEHLRGFAYQTYEKTGDMYSLFYEKGNAVLKNGGYLAYITSNKWMRAGYGRTTRNYFLKHTQPELLTDLGSGIFEEAVVDSSILIFKKQAFQKPFAALDVSREKNVSNLDSFKNRAVSFYPETDESWTIAGPLEQSIKAKIERIGKPLKEWDIQINYGIKTGFNKAFIIDGRKKEALIAQDSKNTEIIKPVLRGRDIKRYKAEFADLWLINTHNGVKDKNIPGIDVRKDYPAVYAYLQQYEEQLIKRQDKGDHWTNLRNCAYIQEFEKEKIIYPNMTLFLPFIFDDKKFYTNQKCFIITSETVALKFLISFLNSKISHHWIRENCPELQGGTRELSKIFFENIPVPPLGKKEQKPFIALVKKIMAKKEKRENTTALENQIDQMVYKLYDLNEEEIKIIESA